MTSNPNEQTKKRQRIIIGSVAGAIGVAVLFGMFLFDDNPKVLREKPQTVTLPMPGTIEDREAWRSQEAARSRATEILIQEMHDQLQAQKQNSTELAKKVEALNSAQKNEISRESAYLPAPIPTVPLPSDTTLLNQPVLPPSVAVSGSSQLEPNIPLPPTHLPARELEMITLSETEGSSVSAAEADENPQVESTSGNKQEAISFIPAGSFVRVAMLNGADVPTGGQAQSNPLPIALHVLDLASLANQHQLDIKDCRFIAAAWGDLSSERMMARTDSLTCIINGEAVEMDVKGQIIGEDGKAGVRGRLVTKQGQLLANALFAGALSGVGKAFSQSASITTAGGGGVTQIPDSKKIVQSVAGEGVGSASNMLAQYYLKAADKLFPVIETDGGRTVEILITKGAVYKGSENVRQTYPNLLKRAALDQRRYLND